MSDNVPEEKPEIQAEAPNKKSFLKKFVKALVWTCGILFVVFIGVLIFRDSIVKFAVAKGGSYLTGTNVVLKDFSTTFSGKIRLNGFAVGNPRGFSSSNAIEFKEIFVHIDIPSLLSDTIKIHQISVSGMAVNFETNLKTTNLNTLQANVESVSGGSEEETPSDEKETPSGEENADEQEKKQKAVYIAKLDTQDSRLAFTSSTINQTIFLPLPPVHMTDIGGKSIADTVDELFAMLINSVNSAAINFGGAVGAAVSDVGNQLGKGISTVGKGLGKETKKLGKDLEKTGKDFFNKFKKSLK